MNKKVHFNFIICVLLFISINISSAQNHKRDSARNYNNVIRWNVSSFILSGGRNLVFGYERIVTPSQSFSLNLGSSSIPQFNTIETDSFSVNKQSGRSGFNGSFDYRFYLKSENKYRAPRGIYVGPYVYYNKAGKKTEWQLNHNNVSEQVNSDVDFAILGMGVQLGYQFVVFKRATIDMVMIGPGVAQYKLTAKFDSSITPEDRAQLQDAIQQAISNKYPGMNLIFEDKQINADGRLGVWSAGFRYIIQIGFRF